MTENETKNESKRTKMSVALTAAKYIGNAYLPLLQRPYRKRKFVPPIEDILLLMSATDLADVIRKREVSAVVVVQAYIDRIKAVNPMLNAVIDERFENAFEDARKADELCSQYQYEELKEKFPLLGVPFTVKEAVGVEGLSQHVGVANRKGMKCLKEGPAISNLRKAGAIPLCVTNVPEWCLSWETHNLIQGRTFNPYNTTYSPGGSSGGESALLGAGASTFGVGSDFMGSCRLPAMFCGVFGHRPTRPLVDLAGSLPIFPDPIIQKVLALGPMCRFSKDLPLLLKIMSGENAPQADLDTPIDIKKIRILFPTTFANSAEDVPVEEEILEKLAVTARELEKAGLQVKKVTIQYEGLFERLLAKLFSADLKEVIELTDIPVAPFACVMEYGKWLLGKSAHNIYAIHGQFLFRHNRYISTKTDVAKSDAYEKEIKDLLGNNSVLLFPTFPTAAYKHHGMVAAVPGMVYGLLPSVFNLPATTVPTGLNKQGLPIGIQVIAGPFQDRLCFAVAQFVEGIFGGWVPPPSE